MVRGIVVVAGLLLMATPCAFAAFQGHAYAGADCWWDNGAPGGGGWYGYTDFNAAVSGSVIDDIAAEYHAEGSGTFSASAADQGAWPLKNYASVHDIVTGNHGPLNPSSAVVAESLAKAFGPVSTPFLREDSAEDHCTSSPSLNADLSHDAIVSLRCDMTGDVAYHQGGIMYSDSGDADGNHYFAYGEDASGLTSAWGFAFDSELVFTNSMTGMTTVSSIPSDAVLLRTMVWIRSPGLCSLVTTTVA